jgi:uncharacterized membrane protein YkvA (DUF1232 family)
VVGATMHADGMADWLLIAAALTVALYLVVLLTLLLLGRRADARAWGGFVPDCAVLFRRLLRDDRVPRGRKLLIGALIGYLALPFDLVPDFIPVAGQLDDAIIVAFVLRTVMRGAGVELVREHWPGPPSSLALMLRLARSDSGRLAPNGPR